MILNYHMAVRLKNGATRGVRGQEIKRIYEEMRRLEYEMMAFYAEDEDIRGMTMLRASPELRKFLEEE